MKVENLFLKKLERIQAEKRKLQEQTQQKDKKQKQEQTQKLQKNKQESFKKRLEQQKKIINQNITKKLKQQQQSKKMEQSKKLEQIKKLNLKRYDKKIVEDKKEKLENPKNEFKNYENKFINSKKIKIEDSNSNKFKNREILNNALKAQNGSQRPKHQEALEKMKDLQESQKLQGALSERFKLNQSKPLDVEKVKKQNEEQLKEQEKQQQVFRTKMSQ